MFLGKAAWYTRRCTESTIVSHAARRLDSDTRST